jgi:hypothetical protein
MKILYGKSNWEMYPCPMRAFTDRAAADGFDAVEFQPALTPEPARDVVAMLGDCGLRCIAGVLTDGATPADHLAYLEEWAERSMEFQPLEIVAHTGRDIFPAEENIRIFRRAVELARQLKIRIAHETHRSRALFSALSTELCLREVPDLWLNADFSHWMVVHESDLRDQPERVELAVRRAGHIHARIGFAEGPQVPHPLAPEWEPERLRHLELWKRIVQLRRADGWDWLIVTPEFGPPQYMPTLPFTGQPVADAWTVNVQFQRWLRENLPH